MSGLTALVTEFLCTPSLRARLARETDCAARTSLSIASVVSPGAVSTRLSEESRTRSDVNMVLERLGDGRSSPVNGAA